MNRLGGVGDLDIKVDNSSNLNQVRRSDQPSELQEGEVCKATVKETLPNNEAIVQVKGKQMQVKVEGNVSKGENVTLEVTDTQGKIPSVKIIASSDASGTTTASTEAMRVIRGMGMTPTPELKMAVALIMSEGFPIDKQTLSELKLFLNKGSGTIAQKMDTLKAVLSKQAPITMMTLSAVQEALHGESLKTLMLQQMNGGQSETASSQNITGILFGSTQVQEQAQTGRSHQLRDALRTLSSVRHQVETEPNLGNLLKQMKQMAEPFSGLDQDIADTLNKAIREAESFHEMGRSSIARNVMTKTLDAVAETLKQKVSVLPEGDETGDASMQTYLQNESLQAIGLQSKDLLITQVTRRLGEAAEQFKTVKREIVRNLDNLIKSIPQARINVLPQLKPLLENTIDLLDRTILKSELTLFTDMGTEKTLMTASSQLSEARKLLRQGENQQAAQLVNDVKQQLDKLNFKPSITRIQHFLAGDSISLLESASPGKLAAQFAHMTRAFSPDQASARSAFEFIRSLGLNHESEVAQALVLKRDQMEPQELQNNLKATMLQALKQQGEGSAQRIADQPIDKALLNLTGQQILSKTDSHTSMQSLFFSLPVMLGAKPEDVKVYINGRKEGEKLDWENCSVYFLLETKKLGETGIMLTAVNRNLSISIRNDRPGFKESMQPMVERCKERLQEIGYYISHVQFEKLNQDVEKPAVENKPRDKAESEMTRLVTGVKGYDFKV